MLFAEIGEGRGFKGCYYQWKKKLFIIHNGLFDVSV